MGTEDTVYLIVHGLFKASTMLFGFKPVRIILLIAK